MKKIYLLLLFINFQIAVFAQQGMVWNTYQAKQESGVSSTNVRMDLVEKAPLNGYDFLLTVKIKYKVTKESDFPIGNKLKKMYRMKEILFDSINSHTSSKYVGSFMYDGYRYEYYYVKDTSAIEEKIDAVFTKHFRSEKYEVMIKEDSMWDLYLNFLYPNDEIKHFMENRDVIIQLKEAGDVSSYPRTIEHYVLFPNDDIKPFLDELKSAGYDVLYSKEIANEDFPIEVKFTRTDKTTLENMLAVTKNLKTLAEKYNGSYDGWETYVVRKQEK